MAGFFLMVVATTFLTFFLIFLAVVVGFLTLAEGFRVVLALGILIIDVIKKSFNLTQAKIL
ncbi:MAG: hypothetical protein V4708_06370 [Bacteroidota bacterium]